ncbi:PREDICTED: uncharacterized protein LOC108572763 [Habropoda laboriosa]|uniref:uncharacterized protein LOC108572763 n=1 Tax=Habropoda laboriosa TaxID=597456 RepID=UPI00083D4F85|nr:PREDICTED: uncharacterized protein LOC108572763 [Habropoda laboriosa]
MDENKYKRKTARVSKITLIHPNSSVSVTLLEAAEKLAKRRHLELIEVSDSNHKSDRSVYKLINPIEYKDQDDDKKTKVNESNTKWKTTKLFNFKCNINDHDLDIKIRNINKALRKKHMVKIILIHPDGNEHICCSH